jgi:vacuolar-type H+-ATPase subunit C/Vma6
LTQTTRYASVLPKIGAERSKLISEAKLKTLSECKNLAEVVAQLRDTEYQEQISRLTAPITGIKLEHALRETLIETYLKIIKYSPPQAVRYLDIYLLRFEVENIKTLIRTANTKLSAEQRLSRIYLSVEKYFKKIALMEEAAKAPSIAQVVNVFKNTEYGEALITGLKSYEESGSSKCIDIFLDTLFYEKLFNAYESLPKKEKPHANFYVSIKNDSFILLTLLRGKNLNYDSNWLRLVVPRNCFKLSKKEVEAIVSAINFEAAFKIVQDSYYSKYFERAQTPEETMANAEKVFRKAVLQYARSNAIRETFNVGSTLGFITLKKAEVHNLTALSLGVEAEMKLEVIRNQLLI